MLVGAMFPRHCWKLLDPSKPLHITLRRICADRRGWLDDDNLARSFKAVRDQVAENIGRDDGHETMRWKYDQRVGGKYEIEIEVADDKENPRAEIRIEPKGTKP